MASAAAADEVRFNNGDRLTGKVLSAEKGKLKLRTAVAGTVDVDLTDVRTFSTDEPIAIKLTDGTMIRQQVAAAGQPGQVTVPPGPAGVGAGTAEQAVPIASIKTINFTEGWTGSLVAGALITRGNSDTEAFNVSAEAVRRTEIDRLNLAGQYLFGRQREQDTGDKVVNTDQWRLAGKYDRFVSEKLYGFASAAVERDRVAELNLRLTPAAGAGYQWVERPGLNFNTEAGLAWVLEDYENGRRDENVSLKLAYHVDKQLRDGIAAFHNLQLFPSVQDVGDYYLITDAGVRADLTDHLFTEVKVQFRYDPTPAAGASRSDLQYILGAGWKF
jgi:putative salt-induced outer membrane protein YdiY